MKTRIVGIVLVVAVLGTLFVLTGGDNTSHPAPVTSAPSSNDSAFKDLKIN